MFKTNNTQPVRPEYTYTGLLVKENTTADTTKSVTRKRSRTTPPNDGKERENQNESSPEAVGSNSLTRKRRLSGPQHDAVRVQDRSIFNDTKNGHGDDGGTLRTVETSLTEKQKDFIQLWHGTFADTDSSPTLSRDVVGALATLTQSQPHFIFDYASKTYPDMPTTMQRIDALLITGSQPPDQRRSSSLQGPYNFESANAHLPATMLALIQKYMTTCRRSRPRTDGRRSVNTGPYRCTFGCGYRTKRVFDWRRHEETHEPQEIWLCIFCSVERPENPFLVSRKDKFLRHARECHKDVVARRVLERSKVDFVPREELKCPRCGEGSSSWDERCRHVLGHLEDESTSGAEGTGEAAVRDAEQGHLDRGVSDESNNSDEGDGCRTERASPVD